MIDPNAERFAPPGDETCGVRMDACRCQLRKNHAGHHRCVHGHWQRDAEEVSEGEGVRSELGNTPRQEPSKRVPAPSLTSPVDTALEAELALARIKLAEGVSEPGGESRAEGQGQQELETLAGHDQEIGRVDTP